MLTTATRQASTVADLVSYLQTHPSGPANVVADRMRQDTGKTGLLAALRTAQRAGLIHMSPSTPTRPAWISLTDKGLEWTPQPVYLVTFTTDGRQHGKALDRHSVELATVLLAAAETVSAITVTSEHGDDVTADFLRFA
ncbi:hypothetical protein ACWGB8_07915 [Kitasatospora sp. NPDC054939]